MPIQFRCSNCGQKLSITRRKAGKEVTCPGCVHRTRVPKMDEVVPASSTAAPASDEADQSSTGAVLQRQHAEEVLGDESGLRLQVVHSQQTSERSEAEIEIWKYHPNAWLREEDEEEEGEFKISGRELDDSGLDMTPMVDVTFLLLIFFMITASFSMQKSLETASSGTGRRGGGTIGDARGPGRRVGRRGDR